METKSFECYTKSIEDRTVTGIAAVFGNIDVYGDRILPGAFRKTLKESKNRIRHLWMHDALNPPTAAIRDIREVSKDDLPPDVTKADPAATGGLLVAREYLRTPRGDEILEGIRAGAINEMSFGYDPVKFDFEETSEQKGVLIRNLREIRLWDTSDVTWGANSATVASKAAVPFKDTGKAAEDTGWSAPNLGDFTDSNWADLSDSEKRRIAAHFAWTANNPPDNYGDLKLPHHQPAKEGVGPAVWRGVAAAMGALMGARGGVSIPDADTGGVYSHLSRHYEQFDKEPPPKKLMDLAVISQALMEPGALKEGRVLSSRNLARLKDALAVLSDILLAAEPPEDEESAKALTEQLFQRIEIYSRDIYLMR